MGNSQTAIKQQKAQKNKNSMITFKINGTKTAIPTTWDDVKYIQYLALLTLPNSLIHYIHLFTGIPLETLQKAELKNLESISIALSFLTISLKPEPGALSIGKTYIPKDVTIESLGQFEDLRALCNRRPPDLSTTENQMLFADCCLEACAIYVQKIWDGAYDPTKVPDVKLKLKTESCVEILQTGGFFLSKPLNTSTNIPNRYQRAVQLLKKLVQDLPGYRRSLDFLLPSSRQAKE
jgi:hypothetical protein